MPEITPRFPSSMIIDSDPKLSTMRTVGMFAGMAVPSILAYKLPKWVAKYKQKKLEKEQEPKTPTQESVVADFPSVTKFKAFKIGLVNAALPTAAGLASTALLHHIMKKDAELEDKEKLEPEKEPKVELRQFIAHRLCEDTIEQEIINFIKKNPNPSNTQIHSFASSLGVSSSDVNAEIYKLVSAIVAGGKSFDNNVTPADVDPKEFKKGLEVEKEHVDTSNPYAPLIQAKIDLDHLAEKGKKDAPTNKYYTNLAKVEEAAGAEVLSNRDLQEIQYTLRSKMEYGHSLSDKEQKALKAVNMELYLRKVKKTQKKAS